MDFVTWNSFGSRNSTKMNYFRLLIPTLVLTLTLGLAQAQGTAKHNPMRLASYNALSKTAMVIKDAQGKVKAGRVYTGKLARAVNHQRFAVKLHRKGEYVSAIHHSRYARRLAVDAIKANRGKVAGSMETDDAVIKEASPPDAELDGAIPGAELDKVYEKDQEAVDVAVEAIGMNE